MSDQTPPSAFPPVRFLVIGSGAIGTYIGGSLALRGYMVVFLEKPEARRRIVETGLKLEIDGLVSEVPTPVITDTIREALGHGPFDAAVMALKSFDTKTAMQEAFSVRAELPPILCLQNGVENEVEIARILETDRVIPGTLTSAIARGAPGTIILEKKRGVGIAAGYPLSETIVNAFNDAGLNAHLYKSASSMKWSKLLTNLLANASSAILTMTPAEIFSDSRLFRLEAAQLREALLLMKAMGIQVVDLPGTPVRALAFAVQRLPASIARRLLRRAVGEGRGSKMPSFYIDMVSGRGQTEVDYLNGAVVRYGGKLGIPTPVNSLLNKTLSGLTRGDIPMEEFEKQPEKLLHL